MEDFLSRFGQFNQSTGKLYFSNVRSGLIVAVVSMLILYSYGELIDKPSYQLAPWSVLSLLRPSQIGLAAGYPSHFGV